ncbi:flavodoxin [Rhizobium leguminosarum]|uniref:flavodoxin n=1 Tax=Rhizobium leguminosarum TaxID=384 RepID=UPI001C94FD10|nr:flavodoxin [Rhizobium leguminosarum]MBY5591591.1 flavodoxin [Rhizobium leguminosarum]MBY5605427.1 flavodoxin [Rhizobium leguminosarum]
MLRRKFLQSIPVAGAGLTLSVRHASSQQLTTAASTLVAFFSRTGNTRVIAAQIRRAKEADIFEIVPAASYPEDYEATVAQASKETRSGYLPPLANFVLDIARYDTVFLGFPIWGMTTPPVIRSFLRSHELAGKNVRPFITHGGYGIGSSMDVVRSLASESRFQEPFSMECDQERRTLQEVTGWLAE